MPKSTRDILILINANRLNSLKPIVFATVLLAGVNSHAQNTKNTLFEINPPCTESVFSNTPAMLAQHNKCDPRSTNLSVEDDNLPGKLNKPPLQRAADPENKPSAITPNTELANLKQAATNSKIDISRQILRDTELSLNAREKEVTIGFNYAKNDSKSDLRISRARVLTMPIEFNVGITDRLSFQTSLPLLYYSRESITTAHSNDTSDSAVGNLTLGFSYNTRKESEKHSNITTSFSTSLPTKKSSSDNKDDISGSKFIGIRGGISVSKSISPAILFFNFGYKHYLSQSNSQTERLPGDSISYGYGAGLSVNSVLTFSGRVAGTYSKKSKRDGEYLLGSNSEPVNLNLAINYKLDKKLMLSYGIQFGINNDANDSATSLTLVWGL